MRERLRYFRVEVLEMKQAEFAKRIGISQNTLSALELERHPIQDKHIISICNAFNVREEWLRYGEEPIYNEEDEVIVKYKALEEKHKKIIRDIIMALYAKP